MAKRADGALAAARAGNPKAMDRLMRIALPFNRPHRIRVHLCHTGQSTLHLYYTRQILVVVVEQLLA